jgi:hypothetical protein
MTLPAKKQAIVERKANCEGAGIAGGGHVKRVPAVTELDGQFMPTQYRHMTHESSNCIKDRTKRKAVMGPHTSGTTYHFVRVKDCQSALVRRRL